jgi:enoyl-CoA hydratase/carnithine racemase
LFYRRVMTDFVSLETVGAVGVIRLNRPPMNALSDHVQAEITLLAEEVSERKDICAVVLYGGPKVFAAGVDIKEMAGASIPAMMDRARKIARCFDAVASIPKPVVAAVTGYALGGGCELALCADRRIAGSNAKLGQPEILLGLIPGAGGTQRLPRLVGPAKAKDLCFTGRFIDAAEALAIGLVDEVVAPEDVYDTALAYATLFANGPSYAIAAVKDVIDRGLEVDLATGLALERERFVALFGTADVAAGMASFLEHGPGKATFTGA